MRVVYGHHEQCVQLLNGGYIRSGFRLRIAKASHMKNILVSLILSSLTLCVGQVAAASEFVAEAIGSISKLPTEYPDHWILVHDFSFFHMFEGKVLVVDPLAEDVGSQNKGMMTASFIASFLTSPTRNEFYVVETFNSRGGRGGERSDFVTVYDPATLSVIEEIAIPAKRITGMPKLSAVSHIGSSDRFMAVYNFTPGQSVSIVDLEQRKFVGEIPTAGCGFVLANGERSFTSICANGSLLTTHLNAAGEFAGSDKTDVVFDAQNDPIFEDALVIGDTAYYPKFSGQIMPVDISQENVTVGASWWLTSDEERNWRPGGMHIMAADANGAAYVLMNPEGGEGTHKDGGTEVWIYDLAQQQRTGRIELKNRGVSIATSGSGEKRLLIVTNADMAVDVYRVNSGDYVQTLSLSADTPFVVHGAR